ncbi:hypothetical protein K7G98_36335, partial [Saccharothrix sp. MB29]|nr:hypothetical protein [Saccharothrix sp. MB29]
DADSWDARAQALIGTMQHREDPDWWLVLAVDWKDGHEAVLQADALARTHGVVDAYEWKGDAPPRVHDVLADFADWAHDRGLRWTWWEQDADAYYGFLLRPERVAAFDRLAAAAGLHA